MATAVTITPDSAPAPAVTITPDRGPSIGPSKDFVPPVPGAIVAHKLAQGLEEWANMTEEGRKQHPVQAAVGDFASRLKQFLVGGQGGGLDLKSGVLTNPVLGAATGVPEEESLNAARQGYTLLKAKVAAPFQAAKASEAGRAITQTMAPETAAAPLSATRGPATTGGAATTSITNDDVIRHAAEMGVKLTPAQALQTSIAKSEQVLGEEALLTGSKIKEAAAVERGKLADEVSGFQDRIDPQKIGTTPDSAGEHLQESAEAARGSLKKSVNDAYANVKEQQADLAGDVRGSLTQLIHDETYAPKVIGQTGIAAEQPVFQTTAAKAAIKDIQDMLADPAMQGRQSVQSLRNLRTTLLEKGNDYGANALSDSGQRIYKLAAAKVDDAIMDAAKGTAFEDTFREAGRQNSKLQTLYNQRGSPLYRILNTDDPAKVANGILSRSSLQELEALKGEGIDVSPLARQAVEKIKDGGFRITPKGLGGYPDTFLQSLLGPDATKELYKKAEIARRLAENYNPSGSGKVVLGASQVFHPVAAAGAQAARLRSMPQDALNFLPDVASPASRTAVPQPLSPLTGGPLASPGDLFRKANP